MRKWLIGGVALLALAGLGLWLFREQLALATFTRVYTKALQSDPIAELPDGLSLGVCGAGSPMADPTRAGPCLAVVAGRSLFVVDVGEGSVRNLSLMQLPPARVKALFLTHFHSDHITDVGELMLQHWAGGAATAPLPIYGPPGVDRVVAGFMDAYRIDSGYRTAHHGPTVAPPSGFGGDAITFDAPENAPDTLVYDKDGVKVFAFPVNHHPVVPAVGYRFEYKGRSLVISGDTAASPRLIAASKGVDILAHEGLSARLVGIMRDAADKAGRANLAHILHDILSYHATPETVADEARLAGARRLVFYHTVPPLPLRPLDHVFLGDAGRHYDGPISVSHDGDFYTLPAGGGDVVISNRMNRF
jgi:ribonuclease Z